MGDNTFVTTTPSPTPESLAPLVALLAQHAPRDSVDLGAGYGTGRYQRIEYVRFLDEFVIGIAACDDGQLAREVHDAIQVGACCVAAHST